MTERVKTQVKRDHIERLAQAKPAVKALAELIWNAVDADARRVDVHLRRNQLESIDEIVVSDDGSGFDYDEARRAFGDLGGSTKGTSRRSPGGRDLHGRAGEGRFSVFALARAAAWETRGRRAGQPIKFSVTGHRDSIDEFTFSDQAAHAGATGTKLLLTDVDDKAMVLGQARGRQTLTEVFAPYLRRYPDVSIVLDGTKIDPASIEDRVTDIALDDVVLDDGTRFPATLLVIEWKVAFERELLLCDAGGFVLENRKAGIQAPGFRFTAYLRSDYFRDLEAKNQLELVDMQPPATKLFDEAKVAMRDHFRRRRQEDSKSVVDQWKAEKIYPFEDKPGGLTPLEEVERQVFDVVALNVNEYLPDFTKADAKTKSFQLRMLKTALEKSPEDVQRIVQEVLDLPADKQTELAELLHRTTLSAIINASKVVADRLDFLAGLKVLVFDYETKGKVTERKQLHRILAENTWVFGEQFNLSADDEGLKVVLTKHLESQGLDASSIGDAPVTDIDGKQGIVDLMLTRAVKSLKETDHLVIELKRPTVKINQAVVGQIEKYAFAVARDERFASTRTNWVFWAIATEMDDYALSRARQRDKPDGQIFDDRERRLTIWAKTWAELLEECEARLRFFQEGLAYKATQASGIAHLQKVHAKYLAGVFEPVAPAPASPATPTVPTATATTPAAATAPTTTPAAAMAQPTPAPVAGNPPSPGATGPTPPVEPPSVPGNKE